MRLARRSTSREQMREFSWDDLLGDVDPVCLDLDSARQRIAGRVVMVTGAAGSIGSELCRQLLECGPSKLLCVDRAETPLFHLQNVLSGCLRPVEMSAKSEIIYRLADITDSVRMGDLIREQGVRALLHAAAYKHVPLMEYNLQEALKNNVFGLESLMETAGRCGCEDFLLISSDKAVNPTSFMGCTKRIGELIMAARPSPMRCLSVRFGNVLGSQGSVVPLFREQIRVQRRITVTHPDMARYFMRIPHAVSLILQAFSMAEQRDLFVLDMGKPVRILDLARALIRISGVPEDEVTIEFTGVRPGEKMFEELFFDFETRLNTPATKIFRVQARVEPWAQLQQQLAELRADCATGIVDRIRSKVKEIVPQYRWEPKEADVPANLLLR